MLKNADSLLTLPRFCCKVALRVEYVAPTLTGTRLPEEAGAVAGGRRLFNGSEKQAVSGRFAARERQRNGAGLLCRNP